MFSKRKKVNIYVKLSDKSVDFIKNVIMPEMQIDRPIDHMKICDIESWIYNLQDSQIDENGNDIVLDDVTKAKLLSAQDLLEELMGIWGGDNTSEDFDDLNKRLGLIE